MNFNDIPQFPQACWETTVDWNSLEDVLEHFLNHKLAPLNMSPDFQRGHVWTPAQQENYVEYALQGGEVGRHIIFNCPGWMSSFKGPMEIIDGKQRLEAVRAFYRGDIKAFNHYFHEFHGRPSLRISFLFRMTKVETRAGVLQLYLNINAGGTPHSPEEIARVERLLIEEQQKR